jgi:hypothetical protein
VRKKSKEEKKSIKERVLEKKTKRRQLSKEESLQNRDHLRTKNTTKP